LGLRSTAKLASLGLRGRIQNSVTRKWSGPE
jgi:hypothetical protein